MKKHSEFLGMPIEVVSDEDAEKVDYLVCIPLGVPSLFTDNLKGVCCKCGVDVQYRWHAPRKPKRICIDCIVKLEIKEEGNDKSGQ
jgi:hypothetical protein